MKISSLLTVFGGSTAEPCESGWTFDGVNKCWKVLETAQSFDAAKISCEAENAQLGVPNEFVIDNVYRGWPRVWLGVSRNGADFEDFDGNKVTLSHWYLAQPDNHTAAGPENCVELSNAGIMYKQPFGPGFNDLHCQTAGVHPLCQKASSGTTVNKCATGWSQQDFNGVETCYKLFTEKKTWGKAECDCQSHGAHLINVDWTAETEYSKNHFYSGLAREADNFWIAVRTDENGAWSSTIGNLTFPLKEPTWAAGTPDNFMGFHEYCGEIRNIGLDGELSDWGLGEVPINFVPAWNDRYCEDKAKYVCERLLSSDGASLGACEPHFNQAEKLQMSIFGILFIFFMVVVP